MVPALRRHYGRHTERYTLHNNNNVAASRKEEKFANMAVGTSSLQSRLKPLDLLTRQHANYLVIWAGRSPHPQAMTGEELFCSKEFRC